MKYDDDELAEAALLLASLNADEIDRGLPAEWEEDIHARARVVASETRFSTTKAGVVSLDDRERTAPEGGRQALAWLGWFAAAACFAFGVYEWRVTSLARSAAAVNDVAPAAATSPADPRGIVLRGAGGASFYLSPSPTPGMGRITIRDPGSSTFPTRLTLWIATEDAPDGAAVGIVSCSERCGGRDFDFSDPSALAARARRAWLTQQPADATDREAVTVAQGERSP